MQISSLEPHAARGCSFTKCELRTFPLRALGTTAGWRRCFGTGLLLLSTHFNSLRWSSSHSDAESALVWPFSFKFIGRLHSTRVIWLAVLWLAISLKTSLAISIGDLAEHPTGDLTEELRIGWLYQELYWVIELAIRQLIALAIALVIALHTKPAGFSDAHPWRLGKISDVRRNFLRLELKL